MIEDEFRAYLEGRKMAYTLIDAIIKDVTDFDNYLKDRCTDQTKVDLNDLTNYISQLIDEGKNSEERLVSIARYFQFIKRNDLFIHIAGLVNAVDVLPGIAKRLTDLAGEEVRRRVFEGIGMPPIGSSQEEYPHLTQAIVHRMEEELSVEKCKEVLTWNYHGIPTVAFLGHKERFEKANSIDEYLESEHGRFIEEISRFMSEGKVWYEQEITPEVVEFVKEDQELSIGKRIGDWIYVTKMPFAPKKYLEEIDPILKRYYACHCPLARTSIRDGEPKVSPMFCYCSAGFTKLPFDIIFGEPVEIEMLESVLKGNMRCRFAIRVPEGKMK